MESKICELITSNKNWREVIKSKGIRIKEEYNLCIFNYGIGVDFSDPIVQEARGIIIDTESVEVVCWPFRKFCNYGESCADKIDWSTARVQEKIDGSIIKLWYCWGDSDGEGAWQWSTNSMIDAFDAKSESGISFGELIKRADNYDGIKFDELDKFTTYIFELVSPYTQVVVEYPYTRLYHIGTRNNINGEECNVDIGIPKPMEYPLQSLEDCIKAAEELNDNVCEKVEKEGFVVVDGNWNRVKIKSPDYLVKHHSLTRKVVSKQVAINDLFFTMGHWQEFQDEMSPETVLQMKWYDYEVTRVCYDCNKMMTYARALYEEYSHERKAVVMTIKGKLYWNVGMWAIDHMEETAYDYFERNEQSLHELEKYVRDYEV